MRFGMWGTTLALAIVLGACGISKKKYFAQVARANKLEIHLKKKLDRIDYLEGKAKLAHTKIRKARRSDVDRLTRLVAEIARVRKAMGKKERALSRCRASRAVIPKSPPISLTLRGSKCDAQGVTVTLGKGLLVRGVGTAAQRARARSQIRAAVSKALPPIAKCYLKATTRKKRIMEGQLVVTLRVDKRGRARRVKAAHRGLKPRGVVTCAVKALRRMRLTDRTGPIFAALPLHFGRSIPFVTSCGSRGGAAFTRLVFNRVIRSQRSAIQYCFISSGLPVKKLRKARVKVAFTILASGKVGPVSVVSSTLTHAATKACILRTVKRWKFPRPKGAVPLMTPEFRWRKKPRRRGRRRRRTTK